MATGYLNARPRHPAALGVAIALHVGVVAALMAFNPKVVREVITYMPMRPIKADTPPPPIPDKPLPRTEQRQATPPQQHVDARAPVIDQAPVWTILTQPRIDTKIDVPFDPLPDPMPADTKPTLTGAMMVTRGGDVQPPYPAALQRAEVEGSVTVRLDIASDGRVVGVTLVSADDPSFFAATRDWAMKHWRFKPATRDGTAIATTLVKRVVFRIER